MWLYTALASSGRLMAASIRQYYPGVLVAVLVALAARFVAEHYGAPAMLMALLFGIALNFLGGHPTTAPGVGFTARTVLRIGVAILGARISIEMVTALGLAMFSLLIGAMLATLVFGLVLARLIGQDRRFAVLTAGAVAICGASAAMAIAAVLPRDDKSERNLLFTVMGVTILSTVAMILYPILTQALNFGDRTAGIFIGATVHDVAQVVGAGFSISEETGETSTLVKLIRVALLAPLVVLITLAVQWSGRGGGSASGRPPLVPGFVLGFLVLAGLNSAGLIPTAAAAFLGQLASMALLSAIAAVGMKTDLRDILKVGGWAITLLVAETLFLAGVILAGIGLLGI